jgi:iron complex outermembrane recepter protein
VPGVQVAQVNSSRWAVSIRGFNNLYANKVLVLIDGRSLYNRAFSGVFWDGQDVLVEDIERIEVIRGPGGAVWGANAVNGVINIVTKTPADTQGGLLRLNTGTFDRAGAAARYGGSLGRARFRLSTQWSSHGESQLDRTTGADDPWAVFTNAGRLDWERRQNALILEGSFLANHARALWQTLADPSPDAGHITAGTSSTREGAALARWTHTQANGASLQLQGFVTSRAADVADVNERERVGDLDVQYHARMGARQDLVVGGGYRRTSVALDGSFTYSLDPPRSVGTVTNLFVQDELSVTRTIRLTLGSKVERESVTGWSVQPTARAIWDGPRAQHVWVAASRAVRTPSAAELGIRVNLAANAGPGGTPILIGILGNPAYGPETFIDVEAGYRVQLGVHTAVDVTAFRGRYSDVETTEPLTPVFEPLPAPAHVFAGNRFDNLLAVRTRGLEVATHWIPVDWWRIDGSYSGLELTPHVDPASLDALAPRFDGSAPRHQWQVQSTGTVSTRLHVSGSLFHTGRLRGLGVPAYTRADIRLQADVSKDVSIVGTAQNLQTGAHAEFAGDISVLPTLVPRGFGVNLLWRF